MKGKEEWSWAWKRENEWRVKENEWRVKENEWRLKENKWINER